MKIEYPAAAATVFGNYIRAHLSSSLIELEMLLAKRRFGCGGAGFKSKTSTMVLLAFAPSLLLLIQFANAQGESNRYKLNVPTN